MKGGIVRGLTHWANWVIPRAWGPKPEKAAGTPRQLVTTQVEWQGPRGPSAGALPGFGHL